MIQAIIFSMNRAMQCESLLRSMDDMCTGIDRTTVIVRVTETVHGLAYRQLAHENRKISTGFLFEGEGGKGVTPALNDVVRNRAPTENSYVCIHVDDQIYFRPADFHYATRIMESTDAFVWSWRLGTPQDSEKLQGQFGFWRCINSTDRDYSYLWHSDGALYRRHHYLSVLDACAPGWQIAQGIIPNDVEAAGVLAPRVWPNRIHVGPDKPCCMTWQVNKEKTTEGRYGAPWWTIDETRLDVMAQAFLDGKRINNAALYEDTSWTTRFQLPGSVPTHVRACSEASKFYASLIR